MLAELLHRSVSREAEARTHSPFQPPLFGAGPSRPHSVLWQKERLCAATTFIPPMEKRKKKKAAAWQKHPIEQNVFKYLMKE